MNCHVETRVSCVLNRSETGVCKVALLDGQFMKSTFAALKAAQEKGGKVKVYVAEWDINRHNAQARFLKGHPDFRNDNSSPEADDPSKDNCKGVGHVFSHPGGSVMLYHSSITNMLRAIVKEQGSRSFDIIYLDYCGIPSTGDIALSMKSGARFLMMTLCLRGSGRVRRREMRLDSIAETLRLQALATSQQLSYLWSGTDHTHICWQPYGNNMITGTVSVADFLVHDPDGPMYPKNPEQWCAACLKNVRNTKANTVLQCLRCEAYFHKTCSVQSTTCLCPECSMIH